MNGTTEYFATFEELGLQLYLIFSLAFAISMAYKLITDNPKKIIYLVLLVISFIMILTYPLLYEIIVPYPYY